MATESWIQRGSTNTGWVTAETKEGRLALRRLLHKESYSDIRQISSALDRSKELVGRGILYNFKYARLTLFGTEELPYGKKYRTADIASSVPSCSKNTMVQLGGFMISELNRDKPKLALKVISKKINEEIDALTDQFAQKGLELRVYPESPRIPHLSIAEVDRDHREYFDNDKLMELNSICGAQINEVGVSMGNVLLRAVTLPQTLKR